MPGAAAAGAERLVVFAAASLAEPMTALVSQFNARHPDFAAVASFAASSTLARQIENGAPAGIYVSANRRWMDYLVERGLVDGGRRCNLLGNRLVLVASRGSALDIALVPGARLADALGDGRLAMGDPAHVPAGVYGRQALTALGVWPDVKDRLVRTRDVRAALALVARGEVAAGVVYATDAGFSDRVRVVAEFPPETHDAIVYPAARLNDSAAAAAFFAFMTSPDGRALFAGHGFAVAPETPCSP